MKVVKMNIWIIARSYPIQKNKMRGSFELEQARLLADAGHNVSFLAVIFHPINKVKKWGFCSWQDGQIKVYTKSIFYTPDRVHLHLKKFQGKQWKNLLETVELEQGVPDVIHVHYPAMVSDADAILSYQKKGSVVITTDHWTKTLTDSMDSYQRRQLIKYAEQADAFLCVGEPLKNAVQKISNTGKKITVVPNVVSELFKPMDSKSEKFRFIAVGRLVPLKQFDKIVQAFGECFAGQKDKQLTIVGGGKEFKTLEKIIKQYQMSDQVTLTGTLTRKQTAEKVAESDALICYSRLETFGVPVIEAWACGKPVIASDCLGFLEYWKEDLGYIVPWNDRKSLEQAMKKLYQNRKYYCAESISAFAQEYFGEETICNKLVAIYTRAIEQHKNRG